jgi:Golgi phosphoprotein 3
MDQRGPETSFTSGENGHKIAFDPRDLSETEERSKQPKLTLMEEVLLLGLKDKQVSPEGWNLGADWLCPMLPDRTSDR